VGVSKKNMIVSNLLTPSRASAFVSVHPHTDSHSLTDTYSFNKSIFLFSIKAGFTLFSDSARLSRKDAIELNVSHAQQTLEMFFFFVYQIIDLSIF
jgi:hypothetical protein